jgi:hypothetical protein
VFVFYVVEYYRQFILAITVAYGHPCEPHTFENIRTRNYCSLQSAAMICLDTRFACEHPSAMRRTEPILLDRTTGTALVYLRVTAIHHVGRHARYFRVSCRAFSPIDASRTPSQASAGLPNQASPVRAHQFLRVQATDHATCSIWRSYGFPMGS